MVSDIFIVRDLTIQMSGITSVFAMEAGLHILYNTCEAVRYEDTLERARVLQISRRHILLVLIVGQIKFACNAQLSSAVMRCSHCV